MPQHKVERPPRGAARERLLEAAVSVVRAQGWHATTVDDLCTAAGVTKGAFFHHFASKDDLAVATADHWSRHADAIFGDADYHRLDDPADRVLAYVDLRTALIEGSPAEFSCLAGTMVQEAFADDTIRAACADSIFGHAATLDADIAEALAAAGRDPADAPGLARHVQVVLQGGFILSKAAGDGGPTIEALGHLRRYLELLFARR
jgi:TetR/AcrR family transcriptional repressor of nem operon